MKIEVLGMGCPKCKQLTANVAAAVAELNSSAEVSKVEDIATIVNYGVLMTPAIVIDGTVVSTGRVLNKEEIKKLIDTPRGQ
jgi:small redox-active disulfide protein 2